MRADVLKFLDRAPDDRSISYSATPLMDSPSESRPSLDPLVRAALAPGGRVIVECSPDNPIEIGLELVRERAYGDTHDPRLSRRGGT